MIIDDRLVFDRQADGRAKTGRAAIGTVSKRTSAYFPRFANAYSEKSSKFDRLPVNRSAS